MTILPVVAALLVLVILYGWYASIVTRKNRVAEAMSGVDVQLTQRQSLIPNLLAIARKFMAHERELLEEITALRARAGAAAAETDPARMGPRFAVEQELGASIGKLFAVAENYPQLKSDGPMIEAQRAYQEVETNIAAARRFYNAAVSDLRNAVQVFPGTILAGLAGDGTLPVYFEAAESARAPVNAADLL